ncbi:GumN family protein [Chondrocystis sp. NIES-4102]|nr:GumN family protein [Chondrocystis sp. NIES-4102]
MINFNQAVRRYSTVKNRVMLIISLLFIIANSSATSTFATETNKPKELLLWRVDSKPGSIYSVYILGSYHVGKECKLRSPAFEHVFNDVETVVFEVDSVHNALLTPKIQQSLLTLIREKGIPTNHKDSLKGILDPKTYQLLEKKAETLKFPLENIAHLKPWVFILMYDSLRMTNNEYKTDCGIDWIISQMSQAENKKTTGFETIDYQVDKITDSYISMDLDETLDMIESIALGKSAIKEQSQDIEQQLDWLTNSIDSGQEENIEWIINSWCKQEPKDCQSLLYTRNKNWMPKIEQLLKQKQDSLIVVGAGHLVTEQGLIELLKQKGYQIRRFRSNFRLSIEK